MKEFHERKIFCPKDTVQPTKALSMLTYTDHYPSITTINFWGLANNEHTNPPAPPNYEEDEITLKELILKVQEYYQEVKRNWKLVLYITIPIVLFMVGKAWLAPVTYPAKLTFMVNEDEGGGGAVSGILGQFGLGGGGGKYNMDKIVELARSRRIVSAALFQRMEWNGKNDFLANHLIDVYDYHDKWDDPESGLQGFYFQHDSIHGFGRVENTALLSIYGQVVGNPENNVEGIFSIGYGEETSIFSLTVNSEVEDLSITLAEDMYQELSEYYIEKQTEKQLHTYKVAKAKADSIAELLNRKQYGLLKFEDTQKMLALRTSEASKYQLTRDLTAFAAAYGEALKNVEFADFALKSATPFFQVIDQPIQPIGPSKESILKSLILGGIIGVILGIIFIVGKNIFQQTMQDE